MIDIMPSQNPLTLITPVKKERLADLMNHLDNLKMQLRCPANTEFKKLSTVHYCRWVILSEDSFRDPPAIPIPVRLIFSSNYDGDENNHLSELSTVFSQHIDQIYECCEGYPEPGERTTESRKNYLKKWLQKTAAFYVGAPGRSLNQILQEDMLRDYIFEYLNTTKWNNQTALDILQSIRQEVDSKKEFEWSKEKAKYPGINWLGMTITGLVILLFLPLILIFLLFLHFFYERREPVGKPMLSQLPDKNVRRLEEDEDIFNQNQFTQVVVMKPGNVRLFTFNLMMLLGRTLIKNLFVKGELMGIPTIHFARWVLFDNNKHVLFFSNFDGSWQQYLGDFIDKSGWGLTGIFSNTVNFPRTTFLGLAGIFDATVDFPGTNFLLTGGAYDEEHFLAWSRGTQVPTQVWYSAYPHLSIKNVNNNTFIRNDLRRNLSEKEARAFLKRF
jgi:hypothetical protein